MGWSVHVGASADLTDPPATKKKRKKSSKHKAKAWGKKKVDAQGSHVFSGSVQTGLVATGSCRSIGGIVTQT